MLDASPVPIMCFYSEHISILGMVRALSPGYSFLIQVPVPFLAGSCWFMSSLLWIPMNCWNPTLGCFWLFMFCFWWSPLFFIILQVGMVTCLLNCCFPPVILYIYIYIYIYNIWYIYIYTFTFAFFLTTELSLDVRTFPKKPNVLRRCHFSPKNHVAHGSFAVARGAVHLGHPGPCHQRFRGDVCAAWGEKADLTGTIWLYNHRKTIENP